MTIKQGVEEFLLWKGSYLPPTTIKRYKGVLSKIVTLHGDKDITQFSPSDLYSFIEVIKKRYDEGYITTILTVVKMFVSYYQSDIRFPKDRIKPMKKIKESEYATLEEVEYLTEFCDLRTFTGVRNALILRMMFTCGVRVSELLSLRISDLGDGLTPEARIVTLKKRGLEERPIRWNEETHEILIKYLALRLSMDYVEDHLFLNKDGGRFTPRGVQYMLRELCVESGLNKKIRPHMLRHGFSHYQLFEKGANIKELGSMLGHSPNNPMSAMQYLRFDSDEKLKVLRKYI